MQEFSSISVSSYEAGSLADQLTEQSSDGWTVVAIVPTGSTVTAYLSRETEGAPTAGPGDDAETASPPVEDTAAQPAVEVTPEPAAEPAEVTTEPATAPILPTSATTEITPEPASASTAEPAAEVTPEAATPAPTAEATPEPAAEPAAAAAGAAPAGWYADPSGRFELRYWDGGQWTEHVSRAGQQYTDPPVA